jgi:hypothetical protein
MIFLVWAGFDIVISRTAGRKWHSESIVRTVEGGGSPVLTATTEDRLCGDVTSRAERGTYITVLAVQQVTGRWMRWTSSAASLQASCTTTRWTQASCTMTGEYIKLYTVLRELMRLYTKMLYPLAPWNEVAVLLSLISTLRLRVICSY